MNVDVLNGVCCERYENVDVNLVSVMKDVHKSCWLKCYHCLILFMTNYMLWIVFSPLCCCVFVVYVLVGYIYLHWGALDAVNLEGGDGSLLPSYFSF